MPPKLKNKRRGPGRPATGKDPHIGLRMPPERVDAWAARHTVGRSEALHRLAEKALACSTAQDGNPG